MAAWDPKQYLKFESERTQPCRDLVARIELETPRRIVDLGCGPGNSTAVLHARWPSAALVGIDRSTEMLEVARRSPVPARWEEADAATWTSDAPVDLLFSNAALQWLPDHGRQLPRLLGQVASGGAFAVQMPANTDQPFQQVADRLRLGSSWRPFVRPDAPGIGIGSASEYYDILAPHARRVELWDTRYVHVLPGPEAVVEWTIGTGMRPWLAGLPDDAHRSRFLAEYRAGIEAEYPSRADGRVLFPFDRRFFVAYR
jgi:trans-aconitate 2-methyltransferase